MNQLQDYFSTFKFSETIDRSHKIWEVSCFCNEEIIKLINFNFEWFNHFNEIKNIIFSANFWNEKKVPLEREKELIIKFLSKQELNFRIIRRYDNIEWPNESCIVTNNGNYYLDSIPRSYVKDYPKFKLWDLTILYWDKNEHPDLISQEIPSLNEQLRANLSIHRTISYKEYCYLLLAKKIDFNLEAISEKYFCRKDWNAYRYIENKWYKDVNLIFAELPEKIKILEKLEGLFCKKWWFEDYVLKNRLRLENIMRSNEYLEQLYQILTWEFSENVVKAKEKLNEHGANWFFDNYNSFNNPYIWETFFLNNEEIVNRIIKYLDFWYPLKREEPTLAWEGFLYNKVFNDEVLFNRLINLWSIKWLLNLLNINEIYEIINDEVFYKNILELWQDTFKIIRENWFIILPTFSRQNIKALRNVIELYDLWVDKTLLSFYQPYSWIDYSDDMVISILKEFLTEDWSFKLEVLDILSEQINV